MGFLIFLGLYATGAILTARHLVYRTKLANENHSFYGKQLEPRLYSSSELRQIQVQAGHKWDDKEFGDYAVVAFVSAFFWVYWIWTALVALLGLFVLTGVKKTPGELREEREQKERELAALKLDVQKIEEETERLRREQDL